MVRILHVEGAAACVLFVVVPIGALFAAPMHTVAIVLMIVGLAGPILAGLTLARVVGGRGNVIALLGRLKRWRVGW